MSDPLETLLPHRASMLWIDALTSCTEKTARASVTLTAEHFAAANGEVLETALVECVAQTVAAATGRRAQTQAAPDRPTVQGMLVAISHFRIQSPPLLGKLLEIEVRELKHLGPMLLISGLVQCEGQTIASGELTLYA